MVTLPLVATTDAYRVRLSLTSTSASPLQCAVTKNEPANPLDFALTKSLDLKPFEMSTYKKRGWALRDQEVGRQRSADAKEVEEAKQAESSQQKYCTAPFRLGFCSPGQVAYNLVDVGFRIYPGTRLAALVLAATAGLAAQAHNPLQNFARTSPTYVAPQQSAPAQSAPGPKGKIIAINATGSRRYPSGQIAAVSGLRVGDAAGREELQAAADRLAQLGPFAKAGYRFSSRGED